MSQKADLFLDIAEIRSYNYTNIVDAIAYFTGFNILLIAGVFLILKSQRLKNRMSENEVKNAIEEIGQ